MRTLILQANTHGQAVKWIDYERAISLHATDRVAYTHGNSHFTFKGGVNARTGLVSTVEMGNILIVRGGRFDHRCVNGIAPRMTRRTLAARDMYTCG